MNKDSPQFNRFLVDKLHFFGKDLTTKNLLLTQKGDNLKVGFEKNPQCWDYSQKF